MGATNGTATMVVRSAEGPALAKANGPDATRAFEPGSISEAMHLAQVLVASRLLPRAVGTPEAAFAIIATGRELGLTAMQSLRSIHVIEGKPTLSADLVAALVKIRSDVCEWFRLVDSTDQRAVYQTKRRGEPEPTTMAFTMADAQRAGVTGKDNWRKYPAAMLRARCITALARAVYPDLAMGIYDPDEVSEQPAAPGNYEVVSRSAPTVPAAPSSEPTVTNEVHDELAADIEVAKSKADLNRVANAAKKALQAGALSEAQYRALAKMTNARAAQIAKPPTPPPATVPEPTGSTPMVAGEDEHAEGEG